VRRGGSTVDLGTYFCDSGGTLRGGIDDLVELVVERGVGIFGADRLASFCDVGCLR
jgi:hypothetical protein